MKFLFLKKTLTSAVSVYASGFRICIAISEKIISFEYILPKCLITIWTAIGVTVTNLKILKKSETLAFLCLLNWATKQPLNYDQFIWLFVCINFFLLLQGFSDSTCLSLPTFGIDFLLLIFPEVLMYLRKTICRHLQGISSRNIHEKFRLLVLYESETIDD